MALYPVSFYAGFVLAASVAFMTAFMAVKIKEAFKEGFDCVVESMINDGKKCEGELKKD